jgi:hypothetical protein
MSGTEAMEWRLFLDGAESPAAPSAAEASGLSPDELAMALERMFPRGA